jgi:ubiquinol-cytochrome c reductase cytochrome b subunit
LLLNTSIPLVWVARLATLYYFGFFWAVMPLLGLIETPKPLPTSIAQPVLGAVAAE